MNITKEHIVVFFKEKARVNVDDSTRFFSDLGYTGLDADLLLKELVDEFNIDMKYFDYSKYFHDTPYFPFGQYVSAFLGLRKEKENISLDDLVKIINNGSWPRGKST